MSEQAVLFGSGRGLVGVVSDPVVVHSKAAPAVILINAGIVHRVGPNRLYTQIARSLAGHGFVVARFDLSSIGDSSARTDTLTYDKAVIAETVAVMDWLRDHRGADRFILMGICSGAVTSFKTACVDPRVVGIGLMNAQGFDNSQAWNTYVQRKGWARSYLKKALFSPTSWWKALTGKTQYKRLFAVMMGQLIGRFKKPKAVAAVAQQLTTDFQRLLQRRVQTLVIGSEFDHSEDYIDSIMGPDRRHGLVAEVKIDQADHTFTPLSCQQQVIEAIDHWCTRHWPSQGDTVEQVTEETVGVVSN